MDGQVCQTLVIRDVIAEELCARYPDADAVLFLKKRGGRQPTEYIGSLSDMVKVMVSYCAQFPETIVHYTLGQQGGRIGKFMCHCTGSRPCEEKCSCEEIRPWALIALTRVGDTESVVGKSTEMPGSS